MSPFQRRQRWWDRVRGVQVSLGTRDEALAKDVSRMLRYLADPIRDFACLDLIASKRLSAIEVWDAEKAGTRAALVARVLATVPVADDPDLSPLVASWYAELTIGSRDEYLAHVRTFLPESQRFPRSAFTRQAVRPWVQLKPRKYRASLSNFASWLMDRDILNENPVRQVKARKAYAVRTRHLSSAEVDALLAKMAEPFRTLHAVMLGTGSEISAALGITYADIDREAKTIHLKGTKRAHRDRVVRVTEGWAWDVLLAHLRANPGVGPARVFPMSYAAVDYQFRAARKAVGLTDYRIHDHRHTVAVRMLRDRYEDQVVAHQLGHKDASMVRKVYGRYVPQASDYERESATPKRQEKAS